MTKMDLYYVYHHVDPRTNKAVYVGLGQYDRAWCIRKNQRGKNHVEWIEEMYSLGYTLNDIVFIVENQISKEQASKIEKQHIEDLSPIFNKLLNPDHWHINRQVDKAMCLFFKALHEMGYGYQRIAFLSGAEVPKNHVMAIKRRVNYV